LNTRTLLIIIVLVSALSVHAEIIDRIMAVVDGHIITLSDVRREKEIRAVLNEKIPPEDAIIVNDLVDSQIIEDQISQFPGLDITEADVESSMSRISDLHGLQPEILRNAILRRLRAAEFIDVRFRQFLMANDEDIQRYYEGTFVPEAQRRGLNPIPTMDQVANDIRNNVIEEKVMHDVDNWLKSTRRRASIEILQ
jgi:hypothetical protein